MTTAARSRQTPTGPIAPARAQVAAARRARAADLRRRTGLDHRRRAERAMRAIDVAAVLAVAPLVVLALGLAGLAIRLESPGPVLYRQARTGRHGRRFTLWKLRTMVADADARKEELRTASMAGGAAFKLEHDPRVTRVGRVLRKLNLDELPQLWNVLRGEMSLVGPRPTSAAVGDYALWQTARLEVRPGLTGAWQVMPRKNDMCFDDRVRVDIRYLRRRSVRVDLGLVARTATHAVGRAQGM
jgi:lipopolysaccharide/colanic/teichoic acid biosynthesis glycosyltransferase